MLFLLLLWFTPTLQTDNSAVENIIINNGTDPSQGGPTKEWVAQVADGMQKFAMAQAKSGRIAAIKQVDPDLQDTLSSYRDFVGPKNNVTSSSAEADPALSNFAMEGDMIMNPDQIDSLIQGGSRKRAVTTDSTILWTVGKPIAYQIDPSLSSIASKVRAAIKFWNDNSCLSYVESSTALPRLRYYRGQGCWSYVGRQGSWGTQDVSIGVGCESHGTICHETAHAMGFFHTQSRYDRDTYLSINFNNIQSSLSYNFVKKTTGTETHFGLPYDYGSVMQYDPYAFAINNNLPTSVARDKNYQNAMGQREAPSFMDVKEMNLLYKCDSYCSSKPSCQNKGIVNPNTCNSCLCPRYYSGNNCQNLMRGTAPVCNGGNTIQATSSSFTILNATVGLGMTYAYANVDKPSDCYWQIKAPYGKRLQIQIKSITSQCMEGCPWGGYEMNTGNVEQYGMIVCCSSMTQYFTSTADTVLIRGYSRYNNIGMILNYRVA